LTSTDVPEGSLTYIGTVLELSTPTSVQLVVLAQLTPLK
jgi:hypothetical protein